MTETKHNLPIRTDGTCQIWDADENMIAEAYNEETARFIVLACNFHEEMREQMESATVVYGMNDAKCVADSVTELLWKLKEAEDE